MMPLKCIHLKCCCTNAVIINRIWTAADPINIPVMGYGYIILLYVVPSSRIVGNGYATCDWYDINTHEFM